MTDTARDLSAAEDWATRILLRTRVVPVRHQPKEKP